MNHTPFNEITIGLAQSFNVTVSEQMMDDFLRISNDTNPLHVDKKYAQKKGFDNRVVYGMLTASFYSTLVGVHLPGELGFLHGIDIQFSKPVFVGDHLTISGEVTYINEAYKQIEIKASITNQDNKKVSKATIKAGVMDD